MHDNVIARDAMPGFGSGRADGGSRWYELTVKPALTADDLRKLRRPFAPEAVKFLVTSWKPRRDGSVTVVPYVDSSLVMERVMDVDPCATWRCEPLAATAADPLGLEHHMPMLCTMTIKGVTRQARGQLGSAAKDDKHVKAAESDAIKRAAHAFGVGAYLRAVSEVVVPGTQDGGRLRFYWLSKNKRGDDIVGGLTKDGKLSCLDWYGRVVSAPKFVDRYGEVQSYGDVDADTTADDESALSGPETLSEGQAGVLVCLGGFNGRKTPESARRAQVAALTVDVFEKKLDSILLAVGRHLGLSDAERLSLREVCVAEGATDDDVHAWVTQWQDDPHAVVPAEGTLV